MANLFPGPSGLRGQVISGVSMAEWFAEPSGFRGFHGRVVCRAEWFPGFQAPVGWVCWHYMPLTSIQPADSIDVT
jgi:hypothetical protein